MLLRPLRCGLTLIELVVVLAILGLLIALLLPALQAAREAARRAQCSNNLKQIGLAMHNYHAALGCLPASSAQPMLTAKAPAPGSSHRNGKGAGFSWRVPVLPFIEQQALYDRFDLESWPYDGSESHKQAAATKIEVYVCPSYAGPTHSTAPEYAEQSQAVSNYVAVGASHAASLYGEEKQPVGGGKHPNGLIYPGSEVTIRQAKDGLSNTMVFCESREESYAAWLDGTTAAVVALAEETRPRFERAGGETSPFQPVAGVAAAINYGDPEAQPAKAYLPADRHSGKEVWRFGPASRHPGVVNHGFGDGAVRSIAETIDPKVYMALATRAGGEVIRGQDF